MTRPILEKIAERETAVSVKAERLRAEIVQLGDRLREIEHELAELATARKGILALDGDESTPAHSSPGGTRHLDLGSRGRVGAAPFGRSRGRGRLLRISLQVSSRVPRVSTSAFTSRRTAERAPARH
ncbi:hypothetical protein [Streptomyces sp. NPDC047079]|uniref:hypothetical protein n=1 Tax=Streptomyces sp. NPDC047079 TaxID=3154607 RepID=UPI0033C8540D